MHTFFFWPLASRLELQLFSFLDTITPAEGEYEEVGEDVDEVGGGRKQVLPREGGRGVPEVYSILPSAIPIGGGRSTMEEDDEQVVCRESRFSTPFLFLPFLRFVSFLLLTHFHYTIPSHYCIHKMNE